MKIFKAFDSFFGNNSYPNLSLSKTRAWFYSEEGEDIILNKILSKETNGFYVDISNFSSGFSNTYFLYLKGWKGLNIFCQPMDKAVLPVRERDINIFKVISTKTEIKTIVSSEDSAFETRNSFHSNDRGPSSKEIKAEATTLELILKSYLPSNAGYTVKSIGLLNIDSPGNESIILASNNWSSYRSKIILVNDTENRFQFNQDSLVSKLLSKNGYVFFAKTTKYSFYRDANYILE